MKRDFLLEIGTEELPAGFIDGALAHMRRRAEDDLQRLRLTWEDMAVYGTPRRLALVVTGLAARQEDLVEEAKGPSKKVAFAPDGTPTKAAEGFARGQGVAVDELIVRETEQGEYVFAVRREEGAPAAGVLAAWLPEFVAGIPFAKSMRWGAGSLRFARPVRWVAALLGEEVVPFVVDGVSSDRKTYGHRFLAPNEMALQAAGDYVPRMRDAYVLVDVEERRAAVTEAVEAAAAEAGGAVVDDGRLIDEVTHLVEYPVALVGAFEEQYLALPDDVLVTPMREHQRYFPLADGEGHLLARFVAVSNGPRPDMSLIRRGNEKVLSARLADAQFFYDEDTKRPLEDNVEALHDVVFHHKLGSMYDKTMRVQRLVDKMAARLGLGEQVRTVARRGAYLAKADLVTQMVHEFPELQGVMGREYARRAGESDAVAQVVFEHYLPRHTGDGLPESEAGRLVAIADKIDTLVGCFGAGLIPTGSQDPYALRRQALGVMRIVLDGAYGLDVGRLLEDAYDLFEVELAPREETVAKVAEFVRQRLRGLLLDEGIRHDVADAVLGVDGDRPASVVQRARALQAFVEEPAFEALMTAYERVANLAVRAEDDRVDVQRFESEAEVRLYEAIGEAAGRLPKLLQEAAYDEALRLMAELRPAVDKLFDDVMVMAPDEAVRQNRLGLLRRTLQLFQQIARFDAIVAA